MSLTRKLLRGSSINLAEHVIKIMVMFVTTPLMVHHLGPERYGVWIVALVVIGYVRLLDLGVSLTGSRFLGRAIGAGDHERYDELFIAFSYLFNRIGLAAFLVTLILAFVLPLCVPGYAVLSEARWIILGLGLATSFRFWTQIFLVVLKSHLRYDWIGLTSIIKTILQGALVFFLLTQGHGLTSLLLAYVAADAVDQVLLVLFSRRIYPEGRLRVIRERPTGLGPILRYSGTAMMTTLGHQLRNGIDPLVIGHFSGLAFVPVYSIGSRFLSLFTDIVNAIFGGSFIAAFSQLDGRNEPESLTQNFLKAIRFSAALAALGAGYLTIFGPTFIERWIGPSFSDAGKVLLILVGPTTLMLSQYPTWSFFYSRNKQHWLAGTFFWGGAFNVILSILLAMKIGFFGVVWATAIELSVFYGVVVPFLVARVGEIPITVYFWQILRSGLPYLAIAALYYTFIGSFVQPQYLSLLLTGAGLGCLAFPLFWWSTLVKKERDAISSWVSKKRRR